MSTSRVVRSSAFAAFGQQEDDLEGALPPDDGIRTSEAAPIESDPEAAAEIAKLRDPVEQFRFIHEEAREGGNPELVRLEMRSEVYIIEWVDPSAHRFRQDEKPERCPICRVTDFSMDDRVDVRKVVLPLRFSQVEIHRKHVYELIEHFVIVLRAEMMAYHPEPEMTPLWFEKHRGALQIGLTSGPAHNALKRMMLTLGLGDEETIEAITGASLTAAGIALLDIRTKRAVALAEAMAKKAPSPTTASSAAPGSLASIKSS